MRISRINRVPAFCISLLAVSFLIVTAAGSTLLATIPAQNSKSGASANTPGGGQGFDTAKPEAQGTSADSRDKKVKYALLCGIVFTKMDNATGKKVSFSPLQEDGKFSPGGCILLDVSTPKASKVSGELQPSKLIHKVDPIYPEPAIKEHVGIRVVLHINVSEEGLVTDVEATKPQTVPPDRDSKGNWVDGVHAGAVKSINSAAINAVKQWKFSPTLLNGKAIPVMANASITFTFSKDGSPKIIAYVP